MTVKSSSVANSCTPVSMQGKISENFKNVKIDLRKYGTQYTTVWEALNSLLLGNVGGILRIRKLPNELDGHYDRYLDYFWSENELGCTTQSIEFGKNLLDLDYYVKAYDIVNRVTYYGYETKGWWIFAHTNKISVTAEDSESVRIYGSIERCYVADGTASTKESLMKAANHESQENKVQTLSHEPLQKLPIHRISATDREHAWG